MAVLVATAMMPAWAVAQPDIIPVKMRIGQVTDVMELAPLVTDPDLRIRQTAVDRIGASGDVRVLDALLVALNDQVPAIRASVAGSLWRFDHPKVVPSLVKCLGDETPAVVAEATASLGRIASPRVTDALIEAVANGPERVRVQATVMLGKGRDPRAAAPLVAYLRDPSLAMRTATTQALGRIGGPQAVAALGAAALDPTFGARVRCVEALARIKGQAADEALLAASRADVTAVRVAALDGLSRRGTPSDRVLEVLSDPDPGVRAAAAKAQSRLRDPRALGPLLAALGDQDPTVRAAAAEALGGYKEPRVADALMQGLSDVDRGVRDRAAGSLAVLADPRAVEPLLAARRNRGPSPALQQAMRCVGDAITAEVAPALQSEDAERRREAVMILCELQHPRAVEALMAYLPQAEAADRARIASALYQGANSPGAVEVNEMLLERRAPIAFWPQRSLEYARWRPQALRDYYAGQLAGTAANQNPQVAQSLAMLGDPRVLPFLLESVNNASGANRMGALQWITQPGVDPSGRSLAVILQAAQTNGNDMGMAAQALTRVREAADLSPAAAALRATETPAKRAALMALGAMGDARGVPLLVAALKDQDANVREYAALSLGMIGDAGAVEALIAALQDDKEWSRSAAAWALGRIGDARATEPLWAKVGLAGRTDVRIAGALGELGDSRWADLMRRSLASGDSMTRDIAGASMHRIHMPEAFDVLIEMLGSADGGVRYNAARLLGRTGDARAVEALGRALQDTSSLVRWAAATSLGELGDPAAVEGIADLLDQGEDPPVAMMAGRFEAGRPSDPSVMATLALARLGDPRGLDGAVDRLGLELNAVWALSGTKDARALDALGVALHDRDPFFRLLAARALMKSGDPRGAEGLVSLLNEDPSAVIGVLAAKFVGEAKDRRAVPSLIRMVKQGAIDERVAAAEALGQIGDPQAMVPLLGLLNDRHSRGRTAAARALGQIGDPRAIDTLAAFLADDASSVREAEAEALGRLKARAAVGPLTDLLRREKATRVITVATQALENLR
jgi:HEAT repeat protein